MRNEERAALRASANEETEETTVLGLPETEEKEFKFKSIFNVRNSFLVVFSLCFCKTIEPILIF